MLLLVTVAIVLGILSNPCPVPNLTYQPILSTMATASVHQESDPVKPATNMEIVQLMFKFINEQLEAERKLTKLHMEAEKELTDSKILKVI